MLKHNHVRVEFDRRNEKLNAKIRDAQLMKIPYMIVVGDKEAEAKQVSIRFRDGTQASGVSVDEMMKMILKNISERKLTSVQTKEVSH